MVEEYLNNVSCPHCERFYYRIKVIDKTIICTDWCNKSWVVPEDRLEDLLKGGE